jgi:hypothetical protein
MPPPQGGPLRRSWRSCTLSEPVAKEMMLCAKNDRKILCIGETSGDWAELLSAAGVRSVLSASCELDAGVAVNEVEVVPLPTGDPDLPSHAPPGTATSDCKLSDAGFSNIV